MIDSRDAVPDFDDDEEIPILVSESRLKFDKIPVTILCGFLGSGKTTLLNHLLTQNHGKRIAIIENEFSEGLGIESMIIKNGINQQKNDDMLSFFELNNGCICCTVKDSLLITLEQLILHKSKFDSILIEATGLANPGPIISLFWSDSSLDSSLKLDGVVCVVDSVNILSYINPGANMPKDDFNLADDVKMQISYADRILLNKLDLVTEDQMKDVEKEIRLLNGIAEVKMTTFSQIDPSWVLDINGYSSLTLTQQLFNRHNVEDDDLVNEQVEVNDSLFCLPVSFNPLMKKSKKFPTILTAPSSGSGSGSNVASGMGTISIVVKGRMRLDLVNRFLDSILYSNGNLYSNDAITAQRDQRLHQQQGSVSLVNNTLESTNPSISSDSSSVSICKPMRIYRMKGALCVQDSTHWYLLQGVHDIFEITPSIIPLPNSEADHDITSADGAPSADDRNQDHCRSKFIVIGRNLDNNFLYDGLKQCLL